MTKMARLRKSYFDCLYYLFSEESPDDIAVAIIVEDSEGFEELFVDKVCEVKKELISN